MSWKEQARALGFRQRRKVKHCGTDASAYISNSPRGIRLYCFRCQESEFLPHPPLSAADVLAMRRRDQEEARAVYPEVIRLDDPDTPPAAQVWVLKAGLTPERASSAYSFGWSKNTARVIVPVLQNGRPTGLWTGRAVDGRKPKYLMPRGCTGASWYNLRQLHGVCVVVEDILSAIKVVESGFNAMAVLGTTVGPTQAALLADYPVIGWFDADRAGRKGYIKLRRALGLFGVEPGRIETSKDPKAYSREAIKQYIKDAL